MALAMFLVSRSVLVNTCTLFGQGYQALTRYMLPTLLYTATRESNGRSSADHISYGTSFYRVQMVEGIRYVCKGVTGICEQIVYR